MSQTKFDNSNITRFNNIMNSRKTVELSNVNASMKLKVSGTPKYGWYNDTLGKNVDIYSLNANKATVLDSEWFADTLAEAVALEAAGDTKKAGELFDELLNKAQMSFNIINDKGTAERFVKNQPVIGTIELVEVDDKDEKGKATGTTHQSVTFGSVYSPIIPETKSSSRVFEIALPETKAAEPKVEGASQAA